MLFFADLHDFELLSEREISAPRGDPIVIRRPSLIASEGLPVQYTWYRNEIEVLIVFFSVH